MELMQPCCIGRLECANRLVRSATYDGSADKSGAVTDASIEIYRNLGQGNIGLIVTGFAFVSASGQALPRQYGAHSDDMISGLGLLAEAAHVGDSKIALQIVHAGINSSYLADSKVEALAVSPSDQAVGPHREMTDGEAESIISDFGAAARRAREAGFDAVQLHGAHGYLLSQFLSPLRNQRSDRWGGTAENRRRFHLGVVEAVREAVGDEFPVHIKFGLQDDEPGGLGQAEGLEAARALVGAGIEALEVSAGIGSAIQTLREDDPEKAFLRERAAAVKAAVSVPVIAVGGVRSFETASDIVASGDADMVSLCRPFIREPNLVERWRLGDTRPAECRSCSRCLIVAKRDRPFKCYSKDRIQS